MDTSQYTRNICLPEAIRENTKEIEKRKVRRGRIRDRETTAREVMKRER